MPYNSLTLTESFLQPSVPRPPFAFFTVDLESITGLTFFFFGTDLYGLHAHSRREPRAKLPIESNSELIQELLCWVYVPIAPGDRLLAIHVKVDVPLDTSGRILRSLLVRGPVLTVALTTKADSNLNDNS